MQYPKDLLVWEFAPGRRLAEFIITLKNVEGSLARCALAIAEYKINLLSGFHTAPSSSPVGTWSFFADVTDSKTQPDEIARRVRELPFVEAVEIFQSRDGFLVDDRHFPPRWAQRRVMILRTDTTNEMISRLWGVFGTGAATILDEMAGAMGRFVAQEMMNDFGEEFMAANLDRFLKAYSALGMADVEVGEYDRERGSLRLRARGLFECQRRTPAGADRKSVFFRGHLRGFMSAVFKAPFDVVEDECVAAGGEACSFRVTRLDGAGPAVVNGPDPRPTG